MTLLERIDADRTLARKGGQEGASPLVKTKIASVASFLSYLLAEARAVGKDAGNRESTDEEVVAVIRKLIKRNDDNLALTKGEDANAVWQNKLLNQYLPTQLSEENLEFLIKDILFGAGNPRGTKFMGMIMKELKSAYAGQYDPRMASQIAERLLQSDVNTQRE